MTDHLVDNCITCNAELTRSKEDPVQCYECWSSDVDELWPPISGEHKFIICTLIAAVIAVLVFG